VCPAGRGGRERGKGRGRGRGGVAPFLNSRDPRLAGGEKRATFRIINIPL
jgi:hypothetical protein